MTANPLLDAHAVTDLYCDPARLSHQRLRRAKLAGPDVAETICEPLPEASEPIAV